MAELPAGQVHDDFTTWARQNGITIQKVKVSAIPNAGIGIVATEDIKAGETLVFTPSSSLLTREVAAASVSTFPMRTDENGRERGLHALRTHALIAIVLATKSYKEQKSWQDVWPNYNSFKEFMPLLWLQETQQLLTPSAISHVNRQREKLETDFNLVRGLGFEVTKEGFEHAWIIVNTRTLFYKPASYKDALREDCMCLCPFIDYFNHSDEGCKVELSPKGFNVISDREYRAGDQVFVSYGPHNNDFLLCEYGFILDNNKYDDVNIDSFIFPRLNQVQKSHLEGRDFLGDYNLDKTGFCFRSQVALRMSLLNLRSGNAADKLNWLQMYIAGVYDGSREEHFVQETEKHICGEMIDRASDVTKELKRLEGLDRGPSRSNTLVMLRKRWAQVLDIIRELGVNMGWAGRE
ncbi:hypothetical protein BGX38DRAFT_1275233 [Terfezia claveryi]|nr:hypothetical protein BGX38DRAFT_1275233 [Terfezia claveryi]